MSTRARAVGYLCFYGMLLFGLTNLINDIRANRLAALIWLPIVVWQISLVVRWHNRAQKPPSDRR